MAEDINDKYIERGNGDNVALERAVIIYNDFICIYNTVSWARIAARGADGMAADTIVIE